jgi:hypothetical protein
MGTITSANSSIILSVPDVFPTSIVLQGYATDDEFAHESFDITETRMGVDGVLSAGFTPNPKRVTLAFQADSPSIAAFDAWGSAQESAREAFQGSLIIALPSIGKQFTCNVGWLRGFKKLPDAKKVLEPQQYTIEFQDIQPAPI